MIFADKIIRLRKKNGWSQEELAEKIDTSRQAVSKWESAQSIPDIGRVLQLAQLFGVTTDYLLKDELEDEEYTEAETDGQVKRVGMSDADAYLAQRRRASIRIAVATFLCVLSPIPLLLLGGVSEYAGIMISDALAVALGMIALFVVAAIAVIIFIYSGFMNAPYEFLDREPFLCEYGVRGMIEEKLKAFRGTYTILNIVGVGLCIVSPIPLFVSALAENGFMSVIMLTVTMFTAGIGVALLIFAGVRMAAMQRLLKQGEFRPAERKAGRISEAVSTVYWLVVTAIYLGVSFTTGNWQSTWIVWAIAGVLYAALITVCRVILANREENRK